MFPILFECFNTVYYLKKVFILFGLLWSVFNMVFFRMSYKFNKTQCSDFGLFEKNGRYYSKDDNSEWARRYLYDFGWGKENGFCKLPLCNFSDLINIALHSNDSEDSYAAAAIILDDYAEELKFFLLGLIDVDDRSIDSHKINSIFKLSPPINKTIKKGMDLHSIEKEWFDWEMISFYFNK